MAKATVSFWRGVQTQGVVAPALYGLLGNDEVDFSAGVDSSIVAPDGTTLVEISSDAAVRFKIGAGVTAVATDPRKSAGDRVYGCRPGERVSLISGAF